jgi:hypothetical protein
VLCPQLNGFFFFLPAPVKTAQGASAGSAASAAAAATAGAADPLDAKLEAMIGARLDALLSQKMQALSALSAFPTKRAGGRKVTSSAPPCQPHPCFASRRAWRAG